MSVRSVHKRDATVFLFTYAVLAPLHAEPGTSCSEVLNRLSAAERPEVLISSNSSDRSLVTYARVPLERKSVAKPGPPPLKVSFVSWFEGDGDGYLSTAKYALCSTRQGFNPIEALAGKALGGALYRSDGEPCPSEYEYPKIRFDPLATVRTSVWISMDWARDKAKVVITSNTGKASIDPQCEENHMYGFGYDGKVSSFYDLSFKLQDQ